MKEILMLISFGKRTRNRSISWNLRKIRKKHGVEGLRQAVLSLIAENDFSHFRIEDVPRLKSDKRFASRF